MSYDRCAVATAALAMVVWLSPMAASAQSQPISSEQIAQLHFREIGPAVTGGRIHDVEALPNDPSTIYLATASGGIWKSTNKGTTWTPIFENQPVSTFGDLAIAPSNPEVIWAGTGEQNNRQSTSWGNGVYRSNDAGATWTHVGLDDTRHIGRIRVHPDDPDIAYVAALGNLWAPSRSRGVFKTVDGGMTWEQVLYVDTLTGVVDLVMDPSDPNTLYAAAYQRLRRTWGFNGGGPGSGIYKTTDGGRTWRELTGGIPEGDKGRIGLAIAPSDPQVLNALIEHASEGGTYRSEDGGATWERVNRLDQRPMYYSQIFIDPANKNRVYSAATSFYKSEDSGRTFRTMPTRPTYDVGVHSDFHGMWIDPNDTRHFYLVGDAGLYETWDRGETFIRIGNLPIGQFYGIGVDMRDPYYVYGGMQDTHSWMGPSRTRSWIGIINDEWRQIGFGDGTYHRADLTNFRYVYGAAQNGVIVRLDPLTGDHLDIRPEPPNGEPSYRFDWVTPVVVSQHDPSVVYLGGNRLFISRDRGVSWERSEDLSRGIDRDTLRLMGVAGADSMLSKNDGTSSYGEIVTISESPLDARILWVGTDDGNVQVSRDGGRSWTEVSRNISGVPSGTYVSRVAASVSGAGGAYATFDAHRDGDFSPYVYKTLDFGQTWERLVNGLPEGSVNVIVEHRANPSLLFLGTEHALFVSTDGGEHWASFAASLPTTLYDDVLMHPRDGDLVVGTHGRSIYILDDIAPLAEWSAEIASSAAHLFSVRPATIFQYWKDTSYRGQNAYAGENPPVGAVLSYYLSNVSEAAISVTDASGALVRRLEVPGSGGVIHRVYWDLRHEPPPFQPDTGRAEGLPKLPHPVTPRGPFVSPGTYTVTLEAGGARSSRTVEVRGDPLVALSDDQWRGRERFLLELLDLQRRAWDAQQTGEELRRTAVAQRDSLGAENAPPEVVAHADSASALARRLGRVRSRVYNLAEVFNGDGVRQGSLFPPTETHRQRMESLEAELAREMQALSRARPGGSGM